MNDMLRETETQHVTKTIQPAGGVTIVYYTDPLCCWSWAFEPQWRRLRYEFGSHIQWSYCMGGLIPDWKTFNDPMNSIFYPSQLAPVWAQAKHLSKMPMEDKVWIHDPPASSYPSCIAVKTAQLQSHEAGEKYLRKAREAIMLQGQNISKTDVLLAIAMELSQELSTFDYLKFRDDLKQGRGQEEFRRDIQQVRTHSISRFPSLTITNGEGKGVIIVGYRPYSILLDALRQVNPTLAPARKATSPVEYVAYWKKLTEFELTEALS